jgi:hypothetical protein
MNTDGHRWKEDAGSLDHVIHQIPGRTRRSARAAACQCRRLDLPLRRARSDAPYLRLGIEFALIRVRDFFYPCSSVSIRG